MAYRPQKYRFTSLTSRLSRGLFFFIALLFNLTPTVATPVIRDGYEWRQVTDTVDLSWSELDALCPVDQARACGGTLAGFTWASGSEVRSLFESYMTTAPVPTVDTLSLPSGAVRWEAAAVGTTGPEAHLFELDHPLALAALAIQNDFALTRKVVSFDSPSTVLDRIVVFSFALSGWTSDSFEADIGNGNSVLLGGVANLTGIFDQRSCFDIHVVFSPNFCADTDSVQFSVQKLGGRASGSDPFRGGWLYRTDSADVSEPGSLTLMWLAATALLISRRKKHPVLKPR